MSSPSPDDFGFTVDKQLPNGLGRAGTIRTPHGEICTPAFIAVGTKATVKAVLPESVAALGAQAVLANAYHLYLQPGPDIIDEAGGLGRFMNWPGPTFTDSGGFQVMSLGVGFKKVLAMDTTGLQDDDVIAAGKERKAVVDEDGAISTRYGLAGVPALAVIDAEGRLRSVAVGYTTTFGMHLRLWWAKVVAG